MNSLATTSTLEPTLTPGPVPIMAVPTTAEIARIRLSSINITEFSEYAFVSACSRGKLQVAQWLHLIKPDNYNVDYCWVFICACEYGRLLVAKWLLTVMPKNDLTYCLSRGFRGSCRNGMLLVAKWLHQIKPEVVLGDEAEDAFRWSCCSGHLHVAKWLLELHPQLVLCMNDEYELMEICDRGHVQVIQWLLWVCPTISFRVSHEYLFGTQPYHDMDVVAMAEPTLHWVIHRTKTD
jgi:hypothetical protein